jgi:hypothetical protein
MTKLQVAITVSEVLGAFLIWRCWRSDETVFLKFALTILALIPFIGPLTVLWVSNFPDPIHPSLRDNYRNSSDVYDRWIHVLRISNPAKRFLAWKQVRGKED